MLASTRRPWAGVFVSRLAAESGIGFDVAESAGFAGARLLGLIANLGRVSLQFGLGSDGKRALGAAAIRHRVRLQNGIGCGCNFSDRGDSRA